MQNLFACSSQGSIKGILRAAIAMVVVFASQPVVVKSLGHATEIRVQIMDSSTHRPLKDRKVQITLSGTDGKFYDNAPRLVGRTDPDGVVVFDINQPVPPYVAVFVWWAYACSNPQEYSTSAVLKGGVVARWEPTGRKKVDTWCAAGAQVPWPQEQPGKIAFFIHPMNRFVWAWYDTWE